MASMYHLDYKYLNIHPSNLAMIFWIGLEEFRASSSEFPNSIKVLKKLK